MVWLKKEKKRKRSKKLKSSISMLSKYNQNKVSLEHKIFFRVTCMLLKIYIYMYCTSVRTRKWEWLKWQTLCNRESYSNVENVSGTKEYPGIRVQKVFQTAKHASLHFCHFFWARLHYYDRAVRSWELIRCWHWYCAHKGEVFLNSTKYTCNSAQSLAEFHYR